MIVVFLADVDLGLSQCSYRLVEGQILRNEVCVKVVGDSGECLIPFPICGRGEDAFRVCVCVCVLDVL